jgi:hypothetical protein
MIVYDRRKRQELVRYLDVYQIPCTHNISKSKGKWEYCPVLNAGPENYKNMAVFKAGSWYYGTNAA